MKTERSRDKESLVDSCGFSDAAFVFAACFLSMMGADKEIRKHHISFFLDMAGRHWDSLFFGAVGACRSFGRLDMENIGVDGY